MKAITINNLFKSFGAKQVLQGVDLEVNKGEALVILGGSGSGKSVLIKLIVGLLRADQGSIQYLGQDLLNISGDAHDEIMRKFGFLFQGGALFDSLKIWENIAFALYSKNLITKEEAYDLAIKKLAHVGLEEYVADLYPAELSGGMQKRAALARAIALDPEVIFFDEPTTGLDPIMSSIINDLIVKTSKDLGATTITITHDMHSAKTIADKVAMLYEGKIIWTDSVSKLDASGNAIVDQFINGLSHGPIKVKLQDH
jgi:phospholipid/cholesterol/gamma-HCH transport system ATP-binding protein